MTDRSDFKPIQIMPTLTANVILAVSCVADAMTMRRSIIVRDNGGGVYSVHERIEAGEGDQTGALMAGSYDLTLSQALEEAARRVRREERYVGIGRDEAA